jgi:hypothetical protein
VRHPHLRPPKIAYRVFGCGQVAQLVLSYKLVFLTRKHADRVAEENMQVCPDIDFHMDAVIQNISHRGY